MVYQLSNLIIRISNLIVDFPCSYRKNKRNAVTTAFLVLVEAAGIELFDNIKKSLCLKAFCCFVLHFVLHFAFIVQEHSQNTVVTGLQLMFSSMP